MPDRALDRASGVPLWSQLRDDLRRRLGAAPTGPFPGEHALAAEYRVSRSTVREALRGLRAEGLVTAARGRAPRVVPAAAAARSTGALYSLFAAVEAAGMVQSSVVRRLGVLADGVVAARLDLEESTPLVYLERIRLADDEPLALDRVWLPAASTRPLLDADFRRTSLYGELADRCGVHVVAGRERIRAAVPSPAERALLAQPPGTASFDVSRRGFADDVPVEWRRTRVRGDRFVIETDTEAGGTVARITRAR